LKVIRKNGIALQYEGFNPEKGGEIRAPEQRMKIIGKTPRKKGSASKLEKKKHSQTRQIAEKEKARPSRPRETKMAGKKKRLKGRATWKNRRGRKWLTPLKKHSRENSSMSEKGGDHGRFNSFKKKKTRRELEGVEWGNPLLVRVTRNQEKAAYCGKYGLPGVDRKGKSKKQIASVQIKGNVRSPSTEKVFDGRKGRRHGRQEPESGRYKKGKTARGRTTVVS